MDWSEICRENQIFNKSHLSVWKVRKIEKFSFIKWKLSQLDFHQIPMNRKNDALITS